MGKMIDSNDAALLEAWSAGGSEEAFRHPQPDCRTPAIAEIRLTRKPLSEAAGG